MMEREIHTIIGALLLRHEDAATVAPELRALVESRMAYNALVNAIRRRLDEFLAHYSDIVLDASSTTSGIFWYAAMWARYGELVTWPADVLLITVALMAEADDVREAARQVLLARFNNAASVVAEFEQGGGAA